LISLKKYLDLDASGRLPDTPESGELLAATLECYGSVLLAMGKGAVQGCPSLGIELEDSLRALEQNLSANTSTETVKKTEEQVEVQLEEWGGRTANYHKVRSDELREFLIALARTAESLGDRDQCYTNEFKGLTAHLETIADLNDLTEIRASLARRLAELKSSIDQMTRDSQLLVAQLRAEVVNYEAKLKTVEQLSLKDELTGAANRRNIEEQIQSNIENARNFSVVMIDLNRFKQVNDRHGHLAGDDLLRQFAAELQQNMRPGDVVGRWGGDEFLAVVFCDEDGAKYYIERIKKWVFGDYKIHCAAGEKQPVSVHMDAAIGLAAWRPRQTMLQLIERADGAMYDDKRKLRAKDLGASGH
jgi:diguanylate cyclase (GGDEF)-like protein